MKKNNIIAIHNAGEKDMSLLWIEYCSKQSIPYKVVNCYSNNILDDISDCAGLMFHVNVGDPNKLIFGKQLLYSLTNEKFKTYPNFNTLWHYDDKIGQKYLLEKIKAPMVPTYIFYNEKEAYQWIKSTSFPKVFKLRNGASSNNVKLISTQEDAMKITKIAFSKGFSHKGEAWKYVKERWRQYLLGKSSLGGVKYAFKRLLGLTREQRFLGKEFGYVYFQDFIPQNNFDIRVIVIDNKAFAIKRMIRENDFRASGSGLINYEKDNFDPETIALAFNLTDQLQQQCIAFDFIYHNEIPLVVEISYSFKSFGVYEKCQGYWDRDLNWYEGPFNPYGWMVESLLKEINS